MACIQPYNDTSRDHIEWCTAPWWRTLAPHLCQICLGIHRVDLDDPWAPQHLCLTLKPWAHYWSHHLFSLPLEFKLTFGDPLLSIRLHQIDPLHHLSNPPLQVKSIQIWSQPSILAQPRFSSFRNYREQPSTSPLLWGHDPQQSKQIHHREGRLLCSLVACKQDKRLALRYAILR